MRVLITHEESQEVMKAFRRCGHEAYSNDLKDCSGGYPGWHLKSDCFDAINEFELVKGKLDFVGFHPDCTYLTNAGIRWLSSTKPRDGYFYSEEQSDFMS